MPGPLWSEPLRKATSPAAQDCFPTGKSSGEFPRAHPLPSPPLPLEHFREEDNNCKCKVCERSVMD